MLLFKKVIVFESKICIATLWVSRVRFTHLEKPKGASGSLKRFMKLIERSRESVFYDTAYFRSLFIKLLVFVITMAKNS